MVSLVVVQFVKRIACFVSLCLLSSNCHLLCFLCFLFYTSKDDEVVGAVYIVWEANSRTRTFAIPGQAPPSQLGLNFCLNDSLKTCKYLQIFQIFLDILFLDRPHLRNFCFNYSLKTCKYNVMIYNIFLDRPHLRNWASTFASTIPRKLANISPIANIYNLINIDSNFQDVQLS